MIKKIQNKKDFENAIKNDKKNTVVFFKASWCEACTNISKLFSKACDKGVCDAYDADVDDVGEVFHTQGIEAVPTFIVYKNGKPIATSVGSFNDISKYLSKK